MSSKKTIAMIAGAIILLAAVFLAILLTAGTPKKMQPPINEAPSGN